MPVQRQCGAHLNILLLVTGHTFGLETRSLPTLTRSYPRRFTFYVARPSAPFPNRVTGFRYRTS
jgi:hypothetical protein